MPRKKTVINLKEIGILLFNGFLFFCLAYALLGDKLLTTFLLK